MASCCESGFSLALLGPQKCGDDVTLTETLGPVTGAVVKKYSALSPLASSCMRSSTVRNGIRASLTSTRSWQDAMQPTKPAA